MNRITESAPCKVNLYLDVVGLRADGYHGIESVMTTLPLCDTVTVIKTAGNISVRMKSDSALSEDLTILPEEKNLAYRAGKLFFRTTGIDGGAEIEIEKNIPSKAGLGGGSADAAATLRALNKIYSEPLSTEELCRVGLSLGADVPFCVAGGTALCRGIGDEITPIDNKIVFHGAITSEAAEKKSTADAYRAVDRAMCSRIKEKSAVRMAKALEAGAFDAVCKEAYNVFGEACGYPDDVRKLLKSLGALFVLMSGAGPSVISLTENEKEAFELGKKLTDHGYKAYCF